MDEIAKLLNAGAAILGAVAWPVTLLVIALVFQESIRTSLGKIPSMLDRVKKASMAGVVLELGSVLNKDSPERGYVIQVFP